MRVLAPRSDMTGADRTWAARYEPWRRAALSARQQRHRHREAELRAGHLHPPQRESADRAERDGARRSPTVRPGCTASPPTASWSESLPWATGCSSPRPTGNWASPTAISPLWNRSRMGNSPSAWITAKRLRSTPMRQMRHHFERVMVRRRIIADAALRSSAMTAVTSHSSQGLTADRVLVNIDL
jgi:hypothetical protein